MAKRKQVGNPLQTNKKEKNRQCEKEETCFLWYSEERIWLAKCTILQIASLGVSPNTPKEIFKQRQTKDLTIP